MSIDIKIIEVNPGDRDWTTHNYVLHFGAYGWTQLRAWANNLDDALDECIDWIADNAPGLLVDDQVAEEYNRCIAAGMSEGDAQDEASADTTCGGNCGHYILSYEWGIVSEDANEPDDQATEVTEEQDPESGDGQ